MLYIKFENFWQVILIGDSEETTQALVNENHMLAKLVDSLVTA